MNFGKTKLDLKEMVNEVNISKVKGNHFQQSQNIKAAGISAFQDTTTTKIIIAIIIITTTTIIMIRIIIMIKNVLIEFGFNPRNIIYCTLFHRVIFLTIPCLRRKQTESKQTHKMQNSAINVHCLKYAGIRVFCDLPFAV